MIASRHVRRRLDAVPPAVVEDVIRLALDALVDAVPMHTLAANLTEIDWEACEGCGVLIDRDEPAGAIHDCEGVWLCDACNVEESQSACGACGGTGTHDCDEGAACENHGATCGACKGRQP